jgi:hypothetical protein
MNMENGKTTLVASYRRIMAQHSMPYVMEGHYIWLNHAIFNSDSTKVMVLIRHAENPGTFPWSTDLMTMNIDGSGLRCPLPSPFWSGQISHQIWGHRPEDILVDANWRNKGHEYVIFDETRDSFHARKISNGMGPMGHLIYSPDGKWIAADTYPDPETRTQQLAIVNTENGNFEIVGNFAHTKKPDPTDIRCDLHPRWSADGALLTVDSIHDGARNIYILETEKICN